MSGDALFPCPFCGGEAQRIDFGPGDAENDGGSCVACAACQSSGPVEFGRKENFISKWNRRAALAAPAVSGAVDCESCDDERIGGEHFSNPAATCPDCKGTGEIERWRFDAAKQYGDFIRYADHARIVAEKDARHAALVADYIELNDMHARQGLFAHKTLRRAEAAEQRAEALAGLLADIRPFLVDAAIDFAADDCPRAAKTLRAEIARIDALTGQATPEGA